MEGDGTQTDRAGAYRLKDSQTKKSRQWEMEAGINRMRQDLLKHSLCCDLSREARQGAQETVPSDRVATLLTDERGNRRERANGESMTGSGF